MGEIIVGSDARRAGTVTRGELRWNYRAIFPDIYVPKEVEPTMYLRTRGAALWSRRRGVITGRAAAALHGAQWIANDTPIDVLWSNNRAPQGIISRREPIGPGEITWIDGMPVAKSARAGLDIGRHLPHHHAVACLDALAQATDVEPHEILDLAARYKGSRGVRRCREAVAVMDGGAESPQETRLRLTLLERGFASPTTQIEVYDSFGYVVARLDMGWPLLKIAVEYDGEQHRTSDTQYRKDGRRLRTLEAMGWIVIRVIKGDRPHEIETWVNRAFAVREREAMAAKLSA